MKEHIFGLFSELLRGVDIFYQFILINIKLVMNNKK